MNVIKDWKYKHVTMICEKEYTKNQLKIFSKNGLGFDKRNKIKNSIQIEREKKFEVSLN